MSKFCINMFMPIFQITLVQLLYEFLWIIEILIFHFLIFKRIKRYSIQDNSNFNLNQS